MPLSQPQHSALVWTSVAASSGPDLDLLLRAVVDDAKLAYLVHHGGFTQTLLWAVPTGLVMGAGIGWVKGLRNARALAPVLAMGVLTGLLRKH